MTNIALNDLPQKGVNVSNLGAEGDGNTDDRQAIQQALDSGQSPVVIPRGHYRIGGSLRVRSNTQLLVHPTAHIFMANGAGTGPEIFLLTNYDHKNGNENISIKGGIWDGNNPDNPRGPDEPTSYTGVLINFSHVDNLRLSNMTLRDPESYYIRLAQHVTNFRVEHIRFEAMNLRPNQDGVHLGGYCHSGVIQNLQGIGMATPNDDVVALNGDDANDRAQNLGKVCGPIRDIQVRNIKASDCHTFVRLLSVWNAIENIEIDGVRGGCRNSVLNLDAGRYCKVPPFEAEDPQYADGVGELTNVVARNLDIYKSQINSHKPLIHLETRAYGFHVENLHRDYQRDATPGSATFQATHLQPEARATVQGLDARQAGKILKESDLSSPEFFREPGVSDDDSISLQTGVGKDSTLSIPEGNISNMHIGCHKYAKV